jgi:hypothetical protein
MADMDLEALDLDEEAAVDDEEMAEDEGDGDPFADIRAYLETEDQDEIDGFVAAVKAAMGAA